MGDAVGRAGASHTIESIDRSYGGPVDDLVAARRAPFARLRWQYGEISDDTAHTIAVARSLLDVGFLCRRAAARALMDLDLRYDSRRGGLRTLRDSGDLDYCNHHGHGPGAAMRVSPLGLVHTTDEVSELVRDVLKVSTLTHGEPAGLDSAVAVAAAVCATADAYRQDAVVAFVVEAVAAAAGWMPESAGTTSTLIEERYAQTRAAQGDPRRLAGTLGRAVCQSRNGAQIASLGIALGVYWRDVRKAVLSATNLGGDADTRASIAGAVAGTAAPATVPRSWADRVAERNGLDLRPLAAGLAGLRGNAAFTPCMNVCSGRLRVECACRVWPESAVSPR